jgi:hypothetical protein
VPHTNNKLLSTWASPIEDAKPTNFVALLQDINLQNCSLIYLMLWKWSMDNNKQDSNKITAYEMKFMQRTGFTKWDHEINRTA